MNISELRKTFKGRLIAPKDADYDQARAVFYGGIDKHPGAIIRVADIEDIKKAISLAKETGHELAVKSGGHSFAGYSTTDGGFVIDLNDLKKLDIDTKAKTAWAETGLTAAEVTGELNKQNLVIGFGDTGSVGIGGITLGGGVGFLVRKFGLTIDNLLAAEIVTAEGKVFHIDDKNNKDLFWAIRGGGGNFGVVTKFKYKLHDLIVGSPITLNIRPQLIGGYIRFNSGR